MKIYEKIEYVRGLSDREKIRYTWGAVAFSMVFIVFIWIFSWYGGEKKQSSETSQAQGFQELKNNFENIQLESPTDETQAPSLENVLNKAKEKSAIEDNRGDDFFTGNKLSEE